MAKRKKLVDNLDPTPQPRTRSVKLPPYLVPIRERTYYTPERLKAKLDEIEAKYNHPDIEFFVTTSAFRVEWYIQWTGEETAEEVEQRITNETLNRKRQEKARRKRKEAAERQVRLERAHLRTLIAKHGIPADLLQEAE